MTTKTPLKALLIEDSENDALLIARVLRHGGYDLTYEQVDTPEGMRAALAQDDWNLIISDYSMPKFSGRQALKLLQETGLDLPFIIVSGAIGEEEAVAAMKAGAHDYVMKDKLARLVPAVERELAEAQIRQERRQAEEQIRRLSRAVEQNPVAIIITDPQGIVEYTNPQFTEMTGYPREVAIGHELHQLHARSADLETVYELEQAIRTGREWKGELQNWKASGESYWISLSISFIHDPDGQITHCVATGEDITDRKHAEAEKSLQIARMQRQHHTLTQLAKHPALAGAQLQTALHSIAQSAAETLDITRVSIWEFSPERTQLRRIATFSSEDQTPEDDTPPIDIAQYPRYHRALQHQRVIDARDARRDPRTAELMRDDGDAHRNGATLDAPIRLHGQVVGVVRHKHLDAPRDWYPDEITFAGQIADIVAQTLLNANLQRRANELAAITRVSREIMSVPNLKQVFRSIARHAAKLSQSDAGGVFTFQSSDKLYIAAGYGVSKRFLQAIETQGIRAGAGVIGRAVADRQATPISDLAQEPTSPLQNLYAIEEIRAVLAVPMLRTGEVIGGIVLWHRTPRHFTPEEIAFIQALAQQCVNAVVNAQLFEAEAQRRREAETLFAVAQAMSATLDLRQVLETILTELQKVVPYDSASVQQLQGDHLAIIGGRGFRNIEAILSTKFDLRSEETPNRQVIETEEPLILDNAPQKYHIANSEAPTPTTPRSWLGVPLILGDRLLGMIALDKYEESFYTEEHARLASAFAAQAAIAMENARLFEKEEQRAQILSQALEQQRELDRLKDEFIQNVSHELRTPLAIARGYAELLEMGDLGELQPMQEKPVEIISRRLQMLSALIDDINAILETETQPPPLKPLNLAALVRDMLPDYQASANRAELSLHANIAGDVPHIAGDPTSIRRTVDNLIGNALKFTPAGGQITLRLKTEPQTVILEVEDTGIGIPQNQLHLIFKRFYQVDGSSNRRYGGTGLGLALVKSIVEIHGGAIDVQSEVDVGTTFTVRLPTIDSPACPLREASATNAAALDSG
ncbi:MAG: GAF domain-containing protein [Anaerolineales bacterium]